MMNGAWRMTKPKGCMISAQRQGPMERACRNCRRRRRTQHVRRRACPSPTNQESAVDEDADDGMTDEDRLEAFEAMVADLDKITRPCADYVVVTATGEVIGLTEWVREPA